MIDRLRSHFKSEKGFTLIELLVVIAIIAILVVIAIVALNPIRRLRDATNRTAASNVRSAATALSVCITKEGEKGATGNPYGTNPAAAFGANNVTAGGGGAATTHCGSWTDMQAASYTQGSAPSNTNIANGLAGAAPTYLCAWADGVDPANGNAIRYLWTSGNGTLRIQYNAAKTTIDAGAVLPTTTAAVGAIATADCAL